MARLIDYLISDVREQTENEDFSDNIGISDDEFLRYINEAQQRIQARIYAQHKHIFTEEETYSVVADQESYSIPDNSFTGNAISQVEFKHSSDDKDYRPLELRNLKNRSVASGNPQFYIRKNKKFLISPVPSSSQGTLRLSYAKAVRRLDKRRGSIASFTDSGTQITALTLEVSTDSVDTTATAKDNFLCIVGRDGTIKMKNIEYDSISGTTGVVTLTANHTYESGESITVGDYIVVGKDTSTHSELPDHVERYLLAYCAWKILKRDSSADYSEQESELGQMESEIVATFGDIDDDIHLIPEINSDEVWFDTWQ